MSDKLDKTFEGVQRRILKLNYEQTWTDLILYNIKKRTPVDEGTLKASIQAEVDNQGEIMTFTAETGITYAWLQENGWERKRKDGGITRVPPKRFFRTGLSETEIQIEEDLSDLIGLEFEGRLMKTFRKIF